MGKSAQKAGRKRKLHSMSNCNGTVDHHRILRRMLKLKQGNLSDYTGHTVVSRMDNSVGTEGLQLEHDTPDCNEPCEVLLLPSAELQPALDESIPETSTHEYDATDDTCSVHNESGVHTEHAVNGDNLWEPPDQTESPCAEGVASREAILLLEQFCLRHHLTTAAKNDLQKFISVLIPADQNLWTQSSEMDKVLLDKVQVSYRFFCRACLKELKGDHGMLCTQCNKVDTKPDVYATVSVEDQLSLKFQDKKFSDGLEYKSHRANCPDLITDVYDGQRYRELESSGYFSSGTNLTLQMCIDGCPIFKSSNTSAWPILLKINELSPHLRQKRENILVYGIWIGERKPDFEEVLTPLVSDFNIYSRDGLKVRTPTGEAVVRCKMFSAHVDLPAKAALLNMNQFNGAFSCSYCLHPAETCSTKKGGHVKVFPFVAKTVPPLRTDQGFREDARTATKGSLNHGIKGASPLSDLEGFNLVQGVCIDYMHQVFLGITKRLIGLWFDSVNHKQPWYCGRKQMLVSERLCQITPPKELTRLPRPLSSVKFWKASEYKHFLLYYLVPCMRGILPTLYLEHVVLLSTATYLLSKQTITPEDITVAEKALRDFVLVMETLYGPREMTLNVHMLVHAAWMVRLNGPLQVISNFDFEDMMGFIKSAPSGTQSVHCQIVKKVILRQMLPVIWRQSQHSDGSNSLYMTLSQEREIKDTAYGNMEILGARKRMTEREMKRLKRLSVSPLPFASCRDVMTFVRLQSDHVTYTSRLYSRQGRRRDNVVTYDRDNGQTCYGVIDHFISTATKLYVVLTTLSLSTLPAIDGRILRKRCLWKLLDPHCPVSTTLIAAEQLRSKCILFSCTEQDRLLIELPSSSCFD